MVSNALISPLHDALTDILDLKNINEAEHFCVAPLHSGFSKMMYDFGPYQNSTALTSKWSDL